MTRKIFIAFLVLTGYMSAQSVTLPLHELCNLSSNGTGCKSVQIATVTVNGSEIHLMIDTGAMTTVISPRYFKGAQKFGGIKVIGITGDRQQAYMADATFAWSPEMQSGQRVAVMDIPAFEKNVDGILGMDVLSRFSGISFDMKAHTITFAR